LIPLLHVCVAIRFDDQGARYYPPMYFDEFWVTKETVLTLNTTNESLPLKLSYSPIPLMKFQMQLQVGLVPSSIAEPALPCVCVWVW
jgi:hypothetical protein